jgi:hypothetical protein
MFYFLIGLLSVVKAGDEIGSNPHFEKDTIIDMKELLRRISQNEFIYSYIENSNRKFKDTVSCILNEYFPKDPETNQKIKSFIVKEFESLDIFKKLKESFVPFETRIQNKKMEYIDGIEEAANSSKFSEFIKKEHVPETIKDIKKIMNTIKNEKERFIFDVSANDFLSAFLCQHIESMDKTMNKMLTDKNKMVLVRKNLEEQLGYSIEDIIKECNDVYSEYIKCIDDGFAQTIDTILSKHLQPGNLHNYNEIRSKILECFRNEFSRLVLDGSKANIDIFETLMHGFVSSKAKMAMEKNKKEILDIISTSKFANVEEFVANLLSTKSENVMIQLIQELSNTMATATLPTATLPV